MIARSAPRAFRKFDAGANHRSPRADKHDCQVRALVTASGASYADAWQLLYVLQGERRACGFTLVDDLRARDPRLRVVEELAFPAVRGEPRMTGEAFCRKYPRGNFILRMAHHVAAVKDGQVYDTWDSTDRCVYAAWQIEPLGEP